MPWLHIYSWILVEKQPLNFLQSDMLVQTHRKFSAYCFFIVPLVSENCHANQANGKALVNTIITMSVKLYQPIHIYSISKNLLLHNKYDFSYGSPCLRKLNNRLIWYVDSQKPTCNIVVTYILENNRLSWCLESQKPKGLDQVKDE